MTKKIVALSVEYPGVLTWLRHGQAEGLWDLHVIGNDPIEIPKADVYLLGALHPVYRDVIPQLRKLGGKIVVAWASSPGEMDMAKSELENIIAIQRDKALAPDAWACLHPDVVSLFPKAVYLPAPVHLEPERTTAIRRAGIGLFGPATLKKNVLSQLMAVRLYQQTYPEAVLHTNMRPYQPVVEAWGIKTVWYDWLPRAAFLDVLARLEVVLCVSHAESWCYAATDALMMGCKVVASETVRAAAVAGCWSVADPNSPTRIAIGIASAMHYPSPPAIRGSLETMAASQNTAAKIAVEGLLELVSTGKANV